MASVPCAGLIEVSGTVTGPPESPSVDRIGFKSEALMEACVVESNVSDPESAGVSRLTLTLPADVSADSVPVVIGVVQTDGDPIESNPAPIPADTRQHTGSSLLSGR